MPALLGETGPGGCKSTEGARCPAQGDVYPKDRGASKTRTMRQEVEKSEDLGAEQHGSLAHKQRYLHLHEPDTAEDAGPDGVRTDRDGRVWVATRLGLQVCDQPGRVNCILPTPNGKVSNLTFGGENFDQLVCTCGDRVYSRKVKVKGTNGWQPLLKPATPRL